MRKTMRTAKLIRESGATRRQIGWWSRYGFVPVNGVTGQGNRAEWTEDQAVQARILADLVKFFGGSRFANEAQGLVDAVMQVEAGVDEFIYQLSDHFEIRWTA